MKLLKKQRLQLMKDAEKALLGEEYNTVAQYFRNIIDISDQIGDLAIKNEFMEKLEILNLKVPEVSAEKRFVQPENMIFDFIDNLVKAPDFIIKEISQPIEIISPAEAIPAPVSPAPPSKKKVPPTIPAETKPPLPSPPKEIFHPDKGITRPPMAHISKTSAFSVTKQKTPSPLISRPVAPPPLKTAASLAPKPILKTTSKTKPIEDIDIEEEIRRSGTVEEQLRELKKILGKDGKKKIST